jgi:hypothetical protein
LSTDYFTRAEFLTVAGDVQGEKYTPEDIDRAQAEVIERIERWGGTSWATLADPLAGTGAITAGLSVLTQTVAVFAAADVGKQITVPGAGPDGTDLETTIAGFTSTTVVTLAALASTTVSGATIRMTDGDGESSNYRVATQTFDGGRDTYVLHRFPVASIISAAIEDTELGAEEYVASLDIGRIRFGSELRFGLGVFVVVYRYGHGEAPWSVKRPAILAAKSLLGGQDAHSSSIPENVREYNTEGTVFSFGEEEGRPELEPFPWDRGATKAIRSYWKPIGRATGARV